MQSTLNTIDLGTIILILAMVYFVFLAYRLTVSITRPLIFMFEGVFFFLNQILWFFTNPLRMFWKNRQSGTSRGVFLLTTMTGISVVWWFLIYIISTPIRIVLALYYDVVLFLVVSITDNVEELFDPKIGSLKYKTGLKYFFLYVLTTPWRFIKFLAKSFFYLLDSFLFLGISIVFPTLTMLHGTKFREAGTKITQSGTWLVGQGNYAGTGIYFGINEKTAKHYAPKGSDNSVIVSRVTLSFTKTIATLEKDERDLVGLGSSGEDLAKRVKGFYSSVEHWREDLGWWEYCLLKPGKMGSFINSWRLRPVALINDGKIVRTYGGFAHYCSHISNVLMGLASWGMIIWILTLFT
ncbi:MAG: hypothetical protein HWE20_03865 [Gammaproteobacteria bacterium]|nr:hypothetical protein [Gammaproteobacteria bacterium]